MPADAEFARFAALARHVRGRDSKDLRRLQDTISDPRGRLFLEWLRDPDSADISSRDAARFCAVRDFTEG